MTQTASPSLADRLASGFRGLAWRNVALLAAINAAIALALWTEDPRPYWHPLITAQCIGFLIAYCVRVASPWDHPAPIHRLVASVAIGAILGMAVATVIKRYTIDPGYTVNYVIEHFKGFALTAFAGFVLGLLGSLIVHVRIREARSREELHRAETERHLLSKHAIESELKLMQAQVEPHFLFNTLASVQFLTETDPPQASKMLGHLLAYLRASLPQLRRASTTLGQEIELAEAYLNILRMRMGARLEFSIDVPEVLRTHPFPPVLLISVVENAVTHGLEPQAAGGRIEITARYNADRLVITVADNGSGLSGNNSHPGQGVGLSNLRERLTALFGARARFTLEEVAPHGAKATIEVPYEPAAPLSASRVDATA